MFLTNATLWEQVRQRHEHISREKRMTWRGGSGTPAAVRLASGEYANSSPCLATRLIGQELKGFIAAAKSASRDAHGLLQLARTACPPEPLDPVELFNCEIRHLLYLLRLLRLRQLLRLNWHGCARASPGVEAR